MLVERSARAEVVGSGRHRLGTAAARPSDMIPTNVRIPIFLAAAVPLVLGAGAVFAQTEPVRRTTLGEVSAAGGLADFVRSPSALTKVGPEWELRVGLRLPAP